MRKCKVFLEIILLWFGLLSGCSAQKDIDSMTTSDAVRCVQQVLEEISDKAVHTMEKTTITYPEGIDTVEIERWYEDDNCLYVGKQSNGITTTRLQYRGEVYTKTSVNESWAKTEDTDAFFPFGVNGDRNTIEQFSESAITSWKVENEEYCAVFDLPLKEDTQNYTENQIMFYFSTKWELLRVVTHAEYTMESWLDGNSKEIISDMVIEYQDTSTKQIKKQIKSAYETIVLP